MFYEYIYMNPCYVLALHVYTCKLKLTLKKHKYFKMVVIASAAEVYSTGFCLDNKN